MQDNTIIDVRQDLLGILHYPKVCWSWKQIKNREDHAPWSFLVNIIDN